MILLEYDMGMSLPKLKNAFTVKDERGTQRIAREMQVILILNLNPNLNSYPLLPSLVMITTMITITITTTNTPVYTPALKMSPMASQPESVNSIINAKIPNMFFIVNFSFIISHFFSSSDFPFRPYRVVLQASLSF